MPSLQQLLLQLQNMGFTGGMQGVDPQSIMGHMQNIYNLPSDTLTPQMFQGFNPAQIEKASITGWSDILQSGQGTNIGKVQGMLAGQPMRKAQGGFGATGNVNIAKGRAQDVYNRSMQDVLTQAYTGRAQTLGGMQEQVSNWYDIAQAMSSAA